MPDPAVEREMRELRARLDAMETTQRHTVDVGDISEAESENEAGHKGEEVAVEDACRRMPIQGCCKDRCQRKNGHSSV
jgi:hypothetical protein